ncbi:MAG TPA: 30S ribosomal protein S17 [Anaerolineales bacterium]|jgi:small subunit ribosomal protein S17|nr:30S ribosomal protein S17 [Anaerolineales bacterium]
MANERARLVGKVISNKMKKTVVVEISRTKRHPLYGKVVRTSRRLKAHDELQCVVGDVVEIVESKPISKDKRWVVEKIVIKTTGVELVEA